LVVKLPLPADSEPGREPETIQIPPVWTLFKKLAVQMTRAGDSDAVSPQDFKDNICHYQAFQAFNNDEQQDPHEFFVKLNSSLARDMHAQNESAFQGIFRE
jgi:ubiquitin C-terminal hydrolase